MTEYPTKICKADQRIAKGDAQLPCLPAPGFAAFQVDATSAETGFGEQEIQSTQACAVDVAEYSG